MSRERIVLDTNCLLQVISIHSPYRKIWDSFVEGKYSLCVSNSILSEYEEILGTRSSWQLADVIVRAIIESPFTVKVDPYISFRLIYADPDDNKFVDCAVASNARYIVTEDAHFNILRQIKFPKVEITKLDDYLRELENAKE